MLSQSDMPFILRHSDINKLNNSSKRLFVARGLFYYYYYYLCLSFFFFLSIPSFFFYKVLFKIKIFCSLLMIWPVLYILLTTMHTHFNSEYTKKKMVCRFAVWWRTLNRIIIFFILIYFNDVCLLCVYRELYSVLQNSKSIIRY